MVSLFYPTFPVCKALGGLTYLLKPAFPNVPQVPLDYSDPDGQQAAIALVRKPALIPQRSHLYRGPILFNPGGPGGSGVALILAAGNAFSTLLGPQFDIVGFDPRGTSGQ